MQSRIKATIVATHVTTGWPKARRRCTDMPLSTVERWWNGYVELVESGAGGVDCATEDDLRRVLARNAGADQ